MRNATIEKFIEKYHENIIYYRPPEPIFFLVLLIVASLKGFIVVFNELIQWQSSGVAGFVHSLYMFFQNIHS